MASIVIALPVLCVARYQPGMKDMIPAWIDGTLTPVEKLEAHLKGLKHRAVSVFLLHDGEILIQQRALSKYHTPGLWANTCCTHPLWDETPEACALRRLDEELGIRGVSAEWKDQIEYRADVGGGMIEHEVVDMFLATPSTRPNVAPSPDEVAAVRWVSLDKLCAEARDTPEKFTPWLRIYLREHLGSVFGPT